MSSTDQKREALQLELERFIEKTDTSQADLARAMGLSPSRLNQWLSNSYKGNLEVIDVAVTSFLEKQREKESRQQLEFPFVITSIAKKTGEICRMAHLDKDIGLVHGAAGLGKTTALKYYATKNPDTLLIEADLGFSARTLFQHLHKSLGLTGRGTIHAMFEDVVEKLRDSGRLIIVDEAEHLPYRALELLRRVHDKAGIGIVLAGMPRLVENMRGRNGEYAQLYSRIGVAAGLQPLTDADTEKIVSAASKGAAAYASTYHECSRGNARRLVKLVARSQRVAEIGQRPLSQKVIRETMNMLIV